MIIISIYNNLIFIINYFNKLYNHRRKREIQTTKNDVKPNQLAYGTSQHARRNVKISYSRSKDQVCLASTSKAGRLKLFRIYRAIIIIVLQSCRNSQQRRRLKPVKLNFWYRNKIRKKTAVACIGFRAASENDESLTAMRSDVGEGQFAEWSVAGAVEKWRQTQGQSERLYGSSANETDTHVLTYTRTRVTWRLSYVAVSKKGKQSLDLISQTPPNGRTHWTRYFGRTLLLIIVILLLLENDSALSILQSICK
jgi:hypothetical protein